MVFATVRVLASLISHVFQPSAHVSPPYALSQTVAQNNATTVVSVYTISEEERNNYYNGIDGPGKGPPLVYRTGSAKFPWVEPKGQHVHQPSKSLHGVYCTPLNDVWDTINIQIRDVVIERKICYSSIDPARFVIHGEDGKETLGPVVIWIGVAPGSTSANTAHEASQDILELLEKNGVTDVEVEWREAVLWQGAGPALLPVVGTNDPTVHIRRHMTVALGMPITTAERKGDDYEGSVGFFFHEVRDKRGEPSMKVFGVSARHVLKQGNEMYEFKGGDAPRHNVRVNGLRRFQRGLDDIRMQIPHANDDQETQENSGERDPDISKLKSFYKETKLNWADIELHNIGHVHYSPPISGNVDGGYLEDWGTFELDEAKFKDHFLGNIVDLGTAITPEELETMMNRQSDSEVPFKYPNDRLLRINGVVPQRELASRGLDDNDSDHQPCYHVLKDGSATDLTVGCHAGLQSVLRTDVGAVGLALAFYPCRGGSEAPKPFLAQGDRFPHL